MRVIHSPQHALHDGGMELHRGELVPCFEMPARVDYIVAALQRAGLALSPPRAFDDDCLLRVHDAGFVDFLRGAYARWQADGRDGCMLPGAFPARGLRRDRVPAGINGALGHYAFDASSPIVAGTWIAARAAADCAMTAAACVADGEAAAYALCRPPGHHAGRGMFGGYCFLNHAALATQALRDRGAGRVAILDIDYHHGNGTQDIFWRRGDVLFVSIHGSPETEYPYFLGYADEKGEGEGAGCNINLPLPGGSGWDDYREALDAALQTIGRFGADALVVSLGVDTFEGDPISAFRLRGEHFPRIGERIAALRLPTVLVQEGGYAVEAIGDNVAGVLGAFA
ncbi:MAG TPA: histone deacetylase family protein [Rhodanobacteraceae bacterium]|nr:histone deacetylase family protein [Rhodanobacteraceae bacterium]